MIDRSAPRFERMDGQMAVLMWALKVFKHETDQGINPDAWSQNLRATMSFTVRESDDPMDTTAAGAPDIVAAVCVRDHWQEMSEHEQTWCIERICSAVIEHASDWNQTSRAQRFSMAPDRSCAWAVASLLTQQLSGTSRKRAEQAFVAALTHPIEEVRWYATWEVAGLGCYAEMSHYGLCMR